MTIKIQFSDKARDCIFLASSEDESAQDVFDAFLAARALVTGEAALPPAEAQFTQAVNQVQQPSSQPGGLGATTVSQTMPCPAGGPAHIYKSGQYKDPAKAAQSPGGWKAWSCPNKLCGKNGMQWL